MGRTACLAKPSHCPHLQKGFSFGVGLLDLLTQSFRHSATRHFVPLPKQSKPYQVHQHAGWQCWCTGLILAGHSHPGPRSLGFLRSSTQTGCKACDFRKVAGTSSRGELGISTGTVIDPGVRVSAQSPAANSLTFGWSSNMAKLVAEHKTKTLNKDQGQVKVTMRPMTSRKPFHVSSFLLCEESETSASSLDRVIKWSL